MTQEIWKDVIGYEGTYSVSDRGRVRSEPRTAPRIRHGRQVRVPVSEKILKPGKIKNSVLVVCLCQGSKRKTVGVARLVLQHHRPELSGFQVRHLDGDTGNNAVENLYYSQRTVLPLPPLPFLSTSMTDEEMIRMYNREAA